MMNTAFDQRTNSNMDQELKLNSLELQQLIASGHITLDNISDLAALQAQIEQDNTSNFTAPQQENVISQVSQQATNMLPSNTNNARQRAAKVGNRPQSTSDGVFVEITEQPKQRGLRFRYECEGRSAGSVPGEKSTAERKTFPTIKIHNYTGTAVVVVSCVTKDSPYEPHPHNLVGRDCKRGVCTLKVKDTNTISFGHLGIQCAKKKDVEGNLKQRKEINVDPFQTGFRNIGRAGNIDLNVVRLCFQVFLPDSSGKISRIVPPVVSLPIHDKKALNELVICRVDRSSGKAKGGDEVFLLCEKINRDDIGVRFYKEADDGTVEWEDFGDFSANDIHRQFAIVFKTPPYKDPYITRPVEVRLQLKRTNDVETSDSIPFTYMPEDPDPDRILEKRKRKSDSLKHFGLLKDENPTPEDIKMRVKVKVTKSRIKQEKQDPTSTLTYGESSEVPAYTFDNLGVAAAPQHIPSISALSTSTVNMPIPDNTNMGNLTITASESVQQQLANLPEHQQFEILKTLAMQKLQQEALKKQSKTDTAGIVNNTNQFAELFQNAGIPQQTTSSGTSGVLLADVPMQQAMSGNPMQETVDMNNIAQMQQAYLAEGTSVSFESIEGLSGNLMNLDYDPNIAAMENVMSEDGTRQMDETSRAIHTLNHLGS